MSIPRFRLFRALPVLLVALNFGCTGAESKPATDTSSAAEAAQNPSARRTVLFLGTSLTAAQGLDPEQGFPAHIQEKIDSAGLPYEVVNAGQSGETSAGARSRIRWILEQPFDVLVLETGANDMLRGSDVDSLAANLQAVIDTVRSRRPDAAIVLAGMLATPNLGPGYVRRFDALYPEVARRNRLPLIPFLLEGVAGESELNIEDGVHPNARGHEIIAATAWKTLEPVLRERAQEPAR